MTDDELWKTFSENGKKNFIMTLIMMCVAIFGLYLTVQDIDGTFISYFYIAIQLFIISVLTIAAKISYNDWQSYKKIPKDEENT